MMSLNDFREKQILVLMAKDGEKISFKNDNVVVMDKDQKIIFQGTCYRIFAVFVIGDLSLTTGMIRQAKKFGISFVFLSYSFRPYQMLNFMAEGNTLLRQKQYQYQSLGAAKQLIYNKIDNQIELLKTVRRKSDELKENILAIRSYQDELSSARNIQEIMAYEGCASKTYFNALFDNVCWRGRKPRIKFDMANALLDIGYTLLFSFIDSLLGLFGFDRYVGILHRQFYMRKSLTCDIVEPFRVIIDNQVRKGINLGQFQEKDFLIKDKKFLLKIEKTSAYTQIFLKTLLEYKEEMFVYVREFYRSFIKDGLNENFPQWSYK